MKGRPITWNELANIYDAEHSGRPARTLPMDDVFEWAEKQEDRFFVEDDTLHLIEAEVFSVEITNAEIATVIAALRFYQREMRDGLVPYKDGDDHEYWLTEIATDGGTEDALDTVAIDDLIEEKIQVARKL